MKITVALIISFMLITLFSACAGVGHEGDHGGGHNCGLMNNKGNEKIATPPPLIPGHPGTAE